MSTNSQVHVQDRECCDGGCIGADMANEKQHNKTAMEKIKDAALRETYATIKKIDSTLDETLNDLENKIQELEKTLIDFNRRLAGLEDCHPAEKPVDDEQTEDRYETMGFSRALIHLRRGKLMARDGWNGKNQFIYIVDGDISLKKRPYIELFFTEDAEIVPWVASQDDILAFDWFIVGESFGDDFFIPVELKTKSDGRRPGTTRRRGASTSCSG